MISYLIGAHTTRLDNMIWKHWCVPPPTWWLCKLALQDFFWSCVAVILLIKYVLRYGCEKDKSVKYILDAGFGLGGPIKDMLRKWTTRCAMAERKRRKNKTLPSSLVGKKVTKKKFGGKETDARCVASKRFTRALDRNVSASFMRKELGKMSIIHGRTTTGTNCGSPRSIGYLLQFKILICRHNPEKRRAGRPKYLPTTQN